MTNTGYLRFFGLIFFFTTFVLQSCSDDNPMESDPFYRDAFTTASANNLQGTWAIFEVEFEDLKVEVPENYPECGRDFVIFSGGGIYKEYLYNGNTDCNPDSNELNWTLNDGIIKLSNSIGQFEEMVIVQLTNDLFVFKAKFDADEDGKLDILTFYAHHYEPVDIDIYTSSFYQESYPDFEDQIRFVWQPYGGFHNFDRYEIYRSSDGCSKSNAELIATIYDKDQDFFIDETPEAREQLCYYFKIYTDQGILGESQLQTVFTDYLQVASVALEEPVVSGQTVELNWAEYDGYYFSHYEITYQNYFDGTGYGYQDVVVAVIEDVKTTNFIDSEPPYVTNPVYTVHVYDIFGNKNNINNNEVLSSQVANFKRPEVLDFDTVLKTAIDPEETVLYAYGKVNPEGNYTIKRINYSTKTIEAIANLDPQVSTELEMKVVQTPNGKEIIFPQANKLYVYDAATLAFKYELSNSELYFIDDYLYLNNNLWAFVSNDHVYTCTRDNANLVVIDKQLHNASNPVNSRYHLLSLENGKIILGHHNNPTSVTFLIDSYGMISNRTIVNVSINSQWQKKTIYNAAQNYLINLLENRIYSITDFSLLESFEQPYYPTGISINGNLILGSNNDPNWSVTDDSLHEKIARIFNRSSQEVNTFASKGYPHLIFENHQGQIISISSGLKRDNLERDSQKPDIFIEIIN